MKSMKFRNVIGRFLAIALAALLFGPVVLGPAIATAQLTEDQIPDDGVDGGDGVDDGDGGDDGGDDGDDGGDGAGAGGVEIDPNGVLSLRTIPQDLHRLNFQRAAAAKASLNRDLATPSKMRKVSLNRLEAEIKKLKEAGQQIPDDMHYLAGMTRITHVFFYPETKDIVIAGPAEGFFKSADNRVLGVNSGASTLKLRDLVVALRAFGPDGARARMISCSIDPTQAGLAALKKVQPQVFRNFRPGNELQVVQAFQQALGMQDITIQGISPNTGFARVMVEADYQMKLIGIGLQDTPVGIVRFIDRAKASDGGSGSLQRWYFQPNYECVHVNQDETAMELVGSGVKLVGANESIANNGGRNSTQKVGRASQNFCTSFTKKYSQLAEQVPLFAELQNCIDMSIAAAFIQEMDFYGQASWEMGLFGNEKGYRVETLNAPTQVAPAINAVWKGQTFMTPIGGGVAIQARQAIRSDNMVVDEKGKIDDAKAKHKIGELGEGQWWWD